MLLICVVRILLGRGQVRRKLEYLSAPNDSTGSTAQHRAEEGLVWNVKWEMWNWNIRWSMCAMNMNCCYCCCLNLYSSLQQWCDNLWLSVAPDCSDFRRRPITRVIKHANIPIQSGWLGGFISMGLDLNWVIIISLSPNINLLDVLLLIITYQLSSVLCLSET